MSDNNKYECIHHTSVLNIYNIDNQSVVVMCLLPPDDTTELFVSIYFNDVPNQLIVVFDNCVFVPPLICHTYEEAAIIMHWYGERVACLYLAGIPSYVDIIRPCVNVRKLRINNCLLGPFVSDLAALRKLVFLYVGSLLDTKSISPLPIECVDAIDFRENVRLDVSRIRSLKRLGIFTLSYDINQTKYEQIFASNRDSLQEMRIYVQASQEFNVKRSLDRIFGKNIIIDVRRQASCFTFRGITVFKEGYDELSTSSSSSHPKALIHVIYPRYLDYLIEGECSFSCKTTYYRDNKYLYDTDENFDFNNIQPWLWGYNDDDEGNEDNGMIRRNRSSKPLLYVGVK